YSIDASGSLFPQSPVYMYSVGSAPNVLSVDPSGKFLYLVNNGDSSISVFALDATGALTQPSPINVPFAAGASPMCVICDPTGTNLYVTSGVAVADSCVSTYGVNTSTGEITLKGSVPTDMQPQWITLDPTGKFVYTANYDGNDVSAFTIDSNGMLQNNIAGSPFGAGMNPHTVSIVMLP
ncbi:MAG TPA: beta-propeller fold lactonase family protein, partial [Spirochaetota bacterium]